MICGPKRQTGFRMKGSWQNLRAGIGILLFSVAFCSVTEAFDVQGRASSPDDFTIDHASDTSTYYQVWVNQSLTNSWTLVRRMYLGENGEQEWTDVGAMTDFPQLYYKVRRLLRESPDDYDGDGIDDVYELERAYLDPLESADALEDEDGDSLNNLYEYGNGTDPDSRDSDNDTIEDDVDPRPTNPNEAPIVQWVSLSSAHNFLDTGPLTIDVQAVDVDGDSMTCESSVDGGAYEPMSGTRRELPVQDLHVGYFVVEARATDAWGMTGISCGTTGYVFRTPPTP